MARYIDSSGNRVTAIQHIDDNKTHGVGKVASVVHNCVAQLPSGNVSVNDGDYIVTNASGVTSVISKSIFEAKYKLL